MNKKQEAVLKAGLEWLCHTGQPDDAIMHHLGLSCAAVDGRWFSFCPTARISMPVVTVRVANAQWDDLPGEYRLKNPLGGTTERDQVAAVIAGLGYAVRETWGNWDGETGSIGLSTPPHPGLVAAVERYNAGCQQHQAKSVFCDCGWFQAGERLLTKPVWPNRAPAKKPARRPAYNGV